MSKIKIDHVDDDGVSWAYIDGWLTPLVSPFPALPEPPLTPLVPEERAPDPVDVARWWAETRGGDDLDLASADTVPVICPRAL